MITTRKITIYPVKSMHGIEQSSAECGNSGLAFDRLFTVTTPDGVAITAREKPILLQFMPTLTEDGVMLSSPDRRESIHVLYQDFSVCGENTTVWDDQFVSYIASIKVNQWLSTILKKDVQLRWLGDHSARRLKNRGIPLSFADAYPYLLINQASFEQLQQRCPIPLDIMQFRPNIIIDGAEAFAEDSWKTIRIGEVIFDLVQPCTRCIMITLDPKSSAQLPRQEPLNTLSEFRRKENGDIDFGYNMIARNRGTISIHDPIEIITTHAAYHYPERKDHLVNDNDLKIEFEGITFSGNNRLTLLEQLEQQGINVPYSCRTGICGQCKLQLIEGEVTPLRKNAILRQQSILSCSCVPKSNLKLRWS